MAAKKRIKIDWEAVEKDYRTDRFSLRALAEKHNTKESTIRSRASSKGWTKDLSSAVESRIKAELLKGGIDAFGDSEDEDIVAAAAKTGVEIIQQHRTDIKDQREIVSLVTSNLRKQLDRGYLEVLDRNGTAVKIDLPLDYMGKVVANTSASLDRLIKLERQAFNMDSDRPPEKPEEKLSEDELNDEIQRLSSQLPK